MLRINTLRTFPFLAAAALSAALAFPSVVGATSAHGGAGGAGKVSYSDLHVVMSTSDGATSRHSGGVNMVMADGSVRFDAFEPTFLGGVSVGTADAGGVVSGRITSIAVDPSDQASDGCRGCVELTVKVLN